ncbi:hypothetical protein EYF80_049250 [Liparis tanakae]|uniref:Uncharacterized protein n=1 Tax=Liparis tanakae TaxID=230148 RepID=A0A4Z2FI29_9TELE|nr:hypothetical protein EYF80_049250 [Liparis tanakae]
MLGFSTLGCARYVGSSPWAADYVLIEFRGRGRTHNGGRELVFHVDGLDVPPPASAEPLSGYPSAASPESSAEADVVRSEAGCMLGAERET